MPATAVQFNPTKVIDTFAISNAIPRLPDVSLLERRGWRPHFHRVTGRVARLILTSERGSLAPRLTLSERYDALWNLRAEVSLGSWLFGSNTVLPDEQQLEYGKQRLAAFVGDATGVQFDIENGRTNRVDYARDFDVGPDKVLRAIDFVGRQSLPRRRKVRYDDTSVNFMNIGKHSSWTLRLYSKSHEVRHRRSTAPEIAVASGILRLELSLRGRGIKAFAQRNSLKGCRASDLLNPVVAENALIEAEHSIHLQAAIAAEGRRVKDLLKICNGAAFLSRVGYAALAPTYGLDLEGLPGLTFSRRSGQRYRADFNYVGLSVLE